jgi:hypothetical protein
MNGETYSPTSLREISASNGFTILFFFFSRGMDTPLYEEEYTKEVTTMLIWFMIYVITGSIEMTATTIVAQMVNFLMK